MDETAPKSCCASNLQQFMHMQLMQFYASYSGLVRSRWGIVAARLVGAPQRLPGPKLPIMYTIVNTLTVLFRRPPGAACVAIVPAVMPPAAAPSGAASYV